MNNKDSIIIVLPCKSPKYIEKELSSAFESLKGFEPERIFVFGLLKNGKIGFDDPFTIYTDSDCDLSDPLLTKNSDVCSEEYCTAVLQPYFDSCFKPVKVTRFLTAEKNKKNYEFFEKVYKSNQGSLFIISRNGTEDPVWPESLRDLPM